MIKNERGSVTVFTLSACLLMSFILVGIFMGSQNKVINQKKQLKSIENSYKENSDNEKMEYYFLFYFCIKSKVIDFIKLYNYNYFSKLLYEGF